MSSLIDIWCDGSWRPAHNVGGAAWIIRQNGQITKGSCFIPGLDKYSAPYGSDIAEMLAVSRAVATVPTNSLVHMRLDCQNIINWLSDRKITPESKKNITPLNNAFTTAISCIQKFREFDLTKISGRGNVQHFEAHKLSRAACHLKR